MVEVQGITKAGLWLLVNEQEFFLPFTLYPWFEQATVAQICAVETSRNKYLHWPEIDVDLELDCLKNPEKYPLVYRK